MRGYPEIVRLLLIAGARLDYVPVMFPVSVLTIAVQKAAEYSKATKSPTLGIAGYAPLDVLQLVLDAGALRARSTKAYVDAQKGSAMLEVQKAHGPHALEVLRKLLRAGAGVDFLGYETANFYFEGSALAHAVRETQDCSAEIVARAQMLLLAGAMVQIHEPDQYGRDESLEQFARRRADELRRSQPASSVATANHDIADPHCLDRGYYLDRAADLIRDRLPKQR